MYMEVGWFFCFIYSTSCLSFIFLYTREILLYFNLYFICELYHFRIFTCELYPHSRFHPGFTKPSRASLKWFFHHLQSSEKSASRMHALNRLTDFSVTHLLKKRHSSWCAFDPNGRCRLKPKKIFHLAQHLLPKTISLNIKCNSY